METRDELSTTLTCNPNKSLCQDACQSLMLLYIPTSLPQEQAAKSNIQVLCSLLILSFIIFFPNLLSEIWPVFLILFLWKHHILGLSGLHSVKYTSWHRSNTVLITPIIKLITDVPSLETGFGMEASSRHFVASCPLFNGINFFANIMRVVPDRLIWSRSWHFFVSENVMIT